MALVGDNECSHCSRFVTIKKRKIKHSLCPNIQQGLKQAIVLLSLTGQEQYLPDKEAHNTIMHVTALSDMALITYLSAQDLNYEVFCLSLDLNGCSKLILQDK